MDRQDYRRMIRNMGKTDLELEAERLQDECVLMQKKHENTEMGLGLVALALFILFIVALIF